MKVMKERDFLIMTLKVILQDWITGRAVWVFIWQLYDYSGSCFLSRILHLKSYTLMIMLIVVPITERYGWSFHTCRHHSDDHHPEGMNDIFINCPILLRVKAFQPSFKVCLAYTEFQ